MNKKVHSVVLTAVFSAMVFAFTFIVHIPAPSGYVHIGDSVIYICSLLLGSPWGFIAGAVGGGLADIAGGFAAYAPATVIIKPLAAIPFIIIRKKNTKLFSAYSVIASVAAGIINTVGYFAADMLISREYAFVDIAPNLVQAGASAVVFIIFALALDKVKIKDKIGNQ